MGLDQYAFKRDANEAKCNDWQEDFYWRKHAKLQTWMEQLFETKTGLGDAELNCGELELTLDDIAALETAIQSENLPECPGGFFFGHQFQDESVAEYKDQDLRFCQWAREQIEQGHRVYYSCWW